MVRVVPSMVWVVPSMVEVVPGMVREVPSMVGVVPSIVPLGLPRAVCSPCHGLRSRVPRVPLATWPLHIGAAPSKNLSYLHGFPRGRSPPLM